MDCLVRTICRARVVEYTIFSLPWVRVSHWDCCSHVPSSGRIHNPLPWVASSHLGCLFPRPVSYKTTYARTFSSSLCVESRSTSVNRCTMAWFSWAFSRWVTCLAWGMNSPENNSQNGRLLLVIGDACLVSSGRSPDQEISSDSYPATRTVRTRGRGPSGLQQASLTR